MMFWRCQLHCIRAVAVAVHDIVDIAVLQGEQASRQIATAKKAANSTRTVLASVNHGHHCVPLATNAIRSHVQQTDQRRQRLGCVSILAFNSVPVVPLGHYLKTRYLTSSRTSLLTICDGLSSRVPRLIILLLVDHDTVSKWSAQRLRKTIRWSWSCTDKKEAPVPYLTENIWSVDEVDGIR